MAASGEEEVAEGGAGEAVAAEKLSKETALFMIFCCAVVAALVFAWYQRKLRSRRKQTSLGIKYNLALPPERALYEEKADAEPEDPKLRAEWHKEVCSILLRRAIMDIGLHFQVSKDYQHHHALYQRGITIDVWPDVQKAREMLNRELELVKAEAEYLKPGWGEKILPQAAQLRQHLEQMNQKQEMERQKKENEEKTRKRAKKMKEQEQKRKAEAEVSERKRREKLAQELIREEEQQKQKEGDSKAKAKGKAKGKTN